MKFIIFNVAAFLVTSIGAFITLTITKEGTIIDNLYWLTGTAYLPEFQYKPWTFFTYMWLHSGPFHLLGNMLGIYFFGRVLSQFVVNKQYSAIYFLSGFFGFFLYLAFYNIFPFPEVVQRIPILGASGAVMGILGAAVAYAPMMRFNLVIVRPPLILIAGIYALIDISTVTSYSGNVGGSLAHLGGLSFGYLSVKLSQNGKDITGWFSNFISWCVNLFKGARNPGPKMKVKYRNKDFKSPTKEKEKKTKSDADYNVEKKERQAKIDAILDKIKKSGYESLSKAEKDYLFREGKRL